MTRFALGLGSNEGDRLAHLRFAVAQLEPLGSVEAVSSLYETAPIGGPEQDPFLNAAVVLDTELSPDELLSELQAIETEAGRQRRVRWGPRTLDLDILVWEGEAVKTKDLSIPHPRAAERQFVLEPLAEVWPDADVGDFTAAAGLGLVGDQGVDRLRRSWLDDSDTWVGTALVAVQLAWFVGIALAFAADGSLPAGEVGFTHVAGGVIAFIGIVLSFSASRRLGPGLRAVPEPAKDAVLVETGPFALARHPLYGGVVLFLGGTALFLDSVAGFLLVTGLAGLFVAKSEYEEKRLRVRYPAYRAYRLRVRNRLIPFLF